MAGFAVALVACGGILAERLSRGDVAIAVVAHVLLTVAVLAVMRGGHREDGSTSQLGAQAVGAILAIALAHGLLRTSGLGAEPWLSEHPAQFVNDAVAVFAPLAVVWAANRRPPSTVILVATLLVVTAYRATGFMWHLDHGSFAYSVQDFVTGEFAGSAVGVATFRWSMGG